MNTISSTPTISPQLFHNKQAGRVRYSLSLLLITAFTLFSPLGAKAQGYVLGSGGYGNGMGRGGGQGGGFTLGYPGANQAKVDQSLFNDNKEMLRNDVDYEDYLLRKRTTFAQQMQQNEQTDDKLRAYAEQRLKALTQSKSALSAAQQAEAHDLMDWLKKDAKQRANNLAWLKRQDQAIASLEQDQMLSVQGQRNALHNIYEDNLAIQSQYKWNQNMQIAKLHQYQSQMGAVSWGRPPGDGRNYGGYGGGYGGNFNRWGY